MARSCTTTPMTSHTKKPQAAECKLIRRLSSSRYNVAYKPLAVVISTAVTNEVAGSTIQAQPGCAWSRVRRLHRIATINKASSSTTSAVTQAPTGAENIVKSSLVPPQMSSLEVKTVGMKCIIEKLKKPTDKNANSIKIAPSVSPLISAVTNATRAQSTAILTTCSNTAAIPVNARCRTTPRFGSKSR